MISQKRIFVVDDNITSLNICKNILKSYYEVYTAPSAVKLFDLLTRFIPELILLDVSMPDIDGYEAARFLKSKNVYKEIPIIFVTTKDDEKSELEGLDLGAVDYITKPISAPLLLRRMETHLSIFERETELACAYEQNELQLTKLNAVIRAAKIGVWEAVIADNDPISPKNIFSWSDEFRYMLGYKDKSDFPDTFESWYDRLHPDDREKAIEAVTKHLSDKTGKTPYDIEYRLLKKDGEYSYFRAYGETIRDRDGNAVRVAGALAKLGIYSQR